MGWVKGLEPSTPGTTIRCSNQLSYTHHILYFKFGTPRGIRTPDLLLRRQLLYPAELLAHIFDLLGYGAGDGNRTHVSSLEGWCSTIELRPQGRSYVQLKDNTNNFVSCQYFLGKKIYFYYHSFKFSVAKSEQVMYNSFDCKTDSRRH